MEDWRLDKDAALEPIDLGIDSEVVSEPSAALPRGAKASIFEEDERKASYSSRRRTSVGWTLPPRGHSRTNLQRNTIMLGIEDFEEQGILKEINERDRTLLDKACCSDDVIRVWNHISVFILTRLKEGKGVQIPGLFTITFQTEKSLLPNDTKYYVLKKIPVMIMSKSVIETYCLQNKTEDEFVFRAPSVPLNLTEIANKSKLSRMIVDGSVTEVLHVFARALTCNKKLEFPVANIGKLQIVNRKAVMKFYEEFYKNLGFDMEIPSVEIPFRPVHKSSARESTTLPAEPQQPELDFDILPGQMTPLRRHIPTEDYRSVFHLSEVRSVHEDELLAPVKVEPRAKAFGKFKRSVLPKSYPSNLLERSIYITQEKTTGIHKSDIRKGTFDPTPIPSLEKLRCVQVQDGHQYFRFLNPDGTKLSHEMEKAVKAALEKNSMMEQCDLPGLPCGLRKVNFECQFKPPRFVRSVGPPKLERKRDKCPGITEAVKNFPSLASMTDQAETNVDVEEMEDKEGESEYEDEEFEQEYDELEVEYAEPDPYLPPSVWGAPGPGKPDFLPTSSDPEETLLPTDQDMAEQIALLLSAAGIDDPKPDHVLAEMASILADQARLKGVSLTQIDPVESENASKLEGKNKKGRKSSKKCQPLILAWDKGRWIWRLPTPKKVPHHHHHHSRNRRHKHSSNKRSHKQHSRKSSRQNSPVEALHQDELETDAYPDESESDEAVPNAKSRSKSRRQSLSKTERLYVIVELDGKEKVFMVDEILDCKQVEQDYNELKLQEQAEEEAAAAAAAPEKRRVSVHDKSAKPKFYPKELYSANPTGKFTIDMAMGNRTLYLDMLFYHHHRLCTDVLGEDVVMEHFSRRGVRPPRSFTYSDVKKALTKPSLDIPHNP